MQLTTRPPTTGIGLLTGDRLDSTLELYRLLRPNVFAPVRLGGRAATVLPPLPGAGAAIESGDVVVMGSAWARAAAAVGIDVADDVLPSLRQRFDRVLGLDQEASFQLEFADDVVAALDLVIKPHGIYRDRELYAWEVGAWTPDGNWTAKVRARIDADGSLANRPLHLGVPGFFTEAAAMRKLRRRRLDPFGRGVRAMAERFMPAGCRPLEASRPPRATAHFLGQLSHVQRPDALRRIRAAGLSLFGGITDVARRVNGAEGRRFLELGFAERKAWRARLAQEGLLARALPRWAYRASLQSSKAVVSIVGHGEICYRMAEAWAARRILVCQDVSHVETGFPFRPGCNVIFCRPDLGDLTDILDDIEINFARYIEVAEQGHADWLAWAGRVEDHLERQFAPLFTPSIGAPAASACRRGA